MTQQPVGKRLELTAVSGGDKSLTGGATLGLSNSCSTSTHTHITDSSTNRTTLVNAHHLTGKEQSRQSNAASV